MIGCTVNANNDAEMWRTITVLSSILQQWPPHGDPHHPDAGVWWTHWIWMIVWILLVALVIALVVIAITRRRRQNQSPRDILEQRYARGEISTEEYEDRNKS